jgi:hypothetical protein
MYLFFGCAKKEEIVSFDSGQSLADKSNITVAQKNNDTAAPKEALNKGDIGFNPFLTPQEEKKFSGTGKYVPLEYLNLSAVIYSPSSCKAIVNGKIIELGSSIDNKEVVDIRPEEVVLKDSQSEYILKLKKVTVQ